MDDIKDVIVMWVIIILVFLFGALIGYMDKETKMQKEFAKTECAQYNPQTGEFEIFTNKYKK